MGSEETHLAPTRPIPPNFSHKILSVNSGEASWHDENRFRVLAAVTVSSVTPIARAMS